MATSQSNSSVNITLSNTDVYIGVIVFGVIAALLGYVTHTFPTWIGYAGIASTIVAFFALLVDELVIATWWEYITVTLVSVVVGVFGYYTGVPNVTLVVILTWGLNMASAFYHAVSQTGGTYLSPQQETWALAISGAAVAFLTWWLGDPTATAATIITTLVATVAQFLRVSVAGGTSSTTTTPTTA